MESRPNSKIRIGPIVNSVECNRTGVASYRSENTFNLSVGTPAHHVNETFSNLAELLYREMWK